MRPSCWAREVCQNIKRMPVCGDPVRYAPGDNCICGMPSALCSAPTLWQGNGFETFNENCVCGRAPTAANAHTLQCVSSGNPALVHSIQPRHCGLLRCLLSQYMSGQPVRQRNPLLGQALFSSRGSVWAPDQPLGSSRAEAALAAAHWMCCRLALCSRTFGTGLISSIPCRQGTMCY